MTSIEIELWSTFFLFYGIVGTAVGICAVAMLALPLFCPLSPPAPPPPYPFPEKWK